MIACAILLPQEVVAEAPVDDGRIVQVIVQGVTGKLLKNVRGFLELQQLNGKKAPSAARLRYLYRAGESQIINALRPFGYYKATVDSSLTQDDKGWTATYKVVPGKAIRVKTLDIRISGAGKDDPSFQKALQQTLLREGAPLDQNAYEALKKRFQVIASERGYFNAKLEKNEIRIDMKRYVADVMLHFSSGDRYKLGDVHFRQEKYWLSPNLLNRYVEIKPGQFYDAGDLQQLQGDLSNSDYFKQVEINASPKSAHDLVIPVEVRLKPQKPHKFIYGIGYGTDTGVRGKVGITGRRVNDRGHHYTSELLVSEIKYGIAGEYIIPGSDPRVDAWGLRSSYVDEHSDTRNFKALTLGGYYKFREGDWLKTYALDYRIERYELGAETRTSSLLIPSAEWTRTLPAALEKRIFATHGAWLRLFVRGGAESLLSDTSFIQPQVSAKWIHSFKNRHRLIGRAAVGTTWVSDFAALPTSLRFFTGGDRTVRGYKYAAIGPINAENEVVGGKHLIEASVEYEFPVREKWSIALFVDSGDAFNESPDYKSGVGIGLHWKSPIGPVRIDFGHGLKQPVGNELLLHLSIGPDL